MLMSLERNSSSCFGIVHVYGTKIKRLLRNLKVHSLFQLFKFLMSNYCDIEVKLQAYSWGLTDFVYVKLSTSMWFCLIPRTSNQITGLSLHSKKAFNFCLKTEASKLINSYQMTIVSKRWTKQAQLRAVADRLDLFNSTSE